MTSQPDRYRKQLLFAGWSEEAQNRLGATRVLLCGCGALGSVIADQLIRSGVGFLRIVDRDFVELSNLQRQVLYDESDVAERIPKAIAAASTLQRINSSVTIEPVVADLNHTNIAAFADGVDLIMDGTDNFEIRFLINDIALEKNIPWINGGCIAAHGQVMTIIPGQTACFRCLLEEIPPPGATDTCDTAGVLGPAVNVVASLQVIDALKILSGQAHLIEPVLTILDIWEGTFRRLSLKDLAARSNCPACKQGERLWLSGARASQSTVLCGRNAVQVSPTTPREVNLADFAQAMKSAGQVLLNPFLVRLQLHAEPFEVTLFRDGRAIIKGTEDLVTARNIYARYVGT